VSSSPSLQSCRQTGAVGAQEWAPPMHFCAHSVSEVAVMQVLISYAAPDSPGPLTARCNLTVLEFSLDYSSQGRRRAPLGQGTPYR
jgi:hypothetical protein